MSKKYTINYFINEISEKVTTKDTLESVIEKISPRYGFGSVKVAVLERYIGSFDDSVYDDGTFRFKNNVIAKTPKTAILKALKKRKEFGA